MIKFFNKEVVRSSPAELLGPLNDIEKKFAPESLYYIGNKSLVVEHKMVSIIGTRNPSDKGIKNAKKITEFLVKNDVVIVSGLARGIDTTAHMAAIKAGGKTVAILGTPLDIYYPRENKLLQKKIMRDYLAISQFRVGSPIYKSNFPARNRTMALISQVSVIVEAGEKSGTIHQGWEALRLGRKLFILEDVLKNKSLTWPSKLIEYGAEILSMDDLNLILDCLPNQLNDEVLCVTF